MASRLSALGHVGLSFETTYGTSVAPTVFIPYESIKVEDDIKKIVDNTKRAILTKDFQVYNATRSGKVEIDTDVYPETVGFFFKSILGQGTVTGSAAPYTHAFKVVNQLAPSLTVSDFNAISERQYAGAVLSEVGLKFDAENVMKMSAKFESFASATTTTATPTFSVTNPFMGFQLKATLNSVQNKNVVGGEVTIKRETKLHFGANQTTNPSKYTTGRIEVTGKMTIDVDDEAELNLFLNGTQPPLLLQFVRDTNTEIDLSFGMIDVTKVTLDRSQEFVRADLQFRAIYNTTDAGMITVTLKNSVATY